MHGQQQPVLLGPEPEQRGAQQRTALEVEGVSTSIGRAPGPRAPLGLRHRLEIDAPQLEGAGAASPARADHRGSERRAQGFVAASDLLERRRSASTSSRPAARRARECCTSPGPAQLIEKPQPLLGKGQRQRPVAVDPRERRPGSAWPAPVRAASMTAASRPPSAPRTGCAAAAPRPACAHARHSAWRGASARPGRRSRRGCRRVDAEHLGPERHQRRSVGVRGEPVGPRSPS